MLNWEGKGAPTAENFPSSGWHGDSVLLHEGDTYTDTLTGDVYTCSIGKSFGLRIDGKSVQETSNLFNPYSVVTANGASVSIAGDSVTITATIASGWPYIRWANIPTSDTRTCTLSAEVPSGGRISVVAYDGSTQKNAAHLFATGSVTLEYDETATMLGVIAYARDSTSGSVGDTKTYSNIMLNNGSAALAYEPFKPNDNTPVPVQVVQGANLLSLTPYRVGSSFYNIAVGAQIAEQSSDANVTISENDGFVTIACSTTWRGAVFVSDPLNEGYTYKLLYGETTTTGNYGRTIYTLNSNHEVVRNLGNGTSTEASRNTSITIATGEKYIAVAFGVRSVAGTVTVDRPYVVNGSSAQPFIPYGALGLRVHGKNLLNITAASTSYYTVNSDGSVTFSGETSNLFLDLGTVKVKSGEIYHLSGCPAGGSTATYRLYPMGKPGSWYDLGNGVTFTATADESLTIRIGVSGSYSSLVFWPMLVKGSQAIPFEPYEETITPIPLNGNVLASVQNGSKDVLTADSSGATSLTKSVGYISTEGLISKAGNTTALTDYARIPFPGVISSDQSPANNTLNGYSNVAPFSGVGYSVDFLHAYTHNTYAYIFAPKADKTTWDKAAAIEWVTEHSAYIYYLLAEQRAIDLGFIVIPDIYEGDTVELIASIETTFDYSFSWLPIWTLTTSGNIGIDWGSSELQTNFRYVQVDKTSWGETKEITDIVGGSISRKYLSAVKEGATLNYENTAQLLNIGNDYLRIYLDANDGQRQESIALGTYKVSTPQQKMSDKGTSGSATCYSVLELVQFEGLDGQLVIPSGTNLIEYAAQLLESRGLNVDIQGSSDITAKNDTFFDAENSILDVVTWCTQAANFGTPLVDGYGTVLLQPYTDPTYNAPSIVYGNDSRVMFPEYSHELDTFSMPNKVIVVCSTPDEVITGTAVNTDPLSPYSTVSRGFVISAKYDIDNLADETAANAKAAELLRSLSLVESVEVEHLYNGSNLRDVFGVMDMGNYATVNQDITLETGCPVKDRGRRFVGGN